MADEEAPPAPEQEPEPEPAPPAEEPPPAEEAAPPAEEPLPPEDAPAEEAPPPEAAPELPMEEAPEVPAEYAPPAAEDQSAELDAAPPEEAPPAEEAAPEAADVEHPPKHTPSEIPKEDDILHDPEIEALEADGMIEEVHILTDDKDAPEEELAEEVDEDAGEEVDYVSRAEKKESMVGMPDDLVEVGQLMEKPEDRYLASSLDMVSKKETLERKKKGVLGSIISIRRGDPTYFDRQKIPKFQNSYKLDSEKPFNAEKVEQILKDVLEDALNELIYDPDKCAKQAKWASSAIRAKVKEQDYDRYKIICYVSIGEKLCQDIFTLLRFLWDVERDGYALYVHETMNLFAVGLCFGIYYE